VVPVTTADDDQAGSHPILVGRKVTLRPGRRGDAKKLRAILAEPSVSRWWAEPDPVEVIEEELRGDDSAVLLVVEIDGKVAGGIQYHEENDPMYRQAGIDIYLGGRFQGRGAGTEAVRLLARFLFEQRGHHRITIDPAAANEPAIRCYTKVGFRPVGVMRQYERGPDGTFHDGLLMDLLRDELPLVRGNVAGGEQRQLHPVRGLDPGVDVSPRRGDRLPDPFGPGRDQPLRYRNAVLDLQREPDRAGHPAPGLDRVHRLGLGAVEQLQRRPPRLEDYDPPSRRTPVSDLLQPQRIPVERHRPVEVLHRQRDPQFRHVSHALIVPY